MWVADRGAFALLQFPVPFRVCVSVVKQVLFKMSPCGRVIAAIEVLLVLLCFSIRVPWENRLDVRLVGIRQ